MMKKWVALWVAVMMLLAVGAAEETQQAAADLFDLYVYEGDGMRWAGTACPLTEGLLVTTASIGRRNGLVVTDGHAVWNAEVAYTENAGLLTVVMFDTEEVSPQTGCFQLPAFGENLKGDSLHVRSGDAEGSRILRTVQKVGRIQWQGQECLQVTLSGSAEIGSALLTDEGELAGILIAQYGEGENRYIAMGAESIYRAAAEAAQELQSLDLTSSGPEGYTVTAEGNLVTFDWSGMENGETEAGKSRYLVVADMNNSFLNYFPAEGTDTSVRLLLTPGRTYVSGMTVTEEAPDDYPEQYVVTALAEAEKLTDYGFRSRACLLAEAPEAGLQEGEKPLPAKQITEELLRSGRVYFYSTSTYDVDREIEGETLLVTLTAPDGNNYRYTSGWIYSPDYEQEDTWFVNLEESGLLDMLNRSGYPAGVYEMAFYVGGKLGDSFTFELP